MDTAIISEFMDDNKVVALYLATMFYAEVSKKPNSTPPGAGAILDLANKFYHWLG